MEKSIQIINNENILEKENNKNLINNEFVGDFFYINNNNNVDNYNNENYNNNNNNYNDNNENYKDNNFNVNNDDNDNIDNNNNENLLNCEMNSYNNIKNDINDYKIEEKHYFTKEEIKEAKNNLNKEPNENDEDGTEIIVRHPKTGKRSLRRFYKTVQPTTI